MEILSHYVKRDEFPLLFKRMGYKVGAEIGVQKGRFSLRLCQVIPDLHLYCVDPWQSYELNPRGRSSDIQDEYYKMTRDLLAPYNVTFLRMMSMEAIGWVPDGSLDFVYIDGNHDFDFVMEDIINWSRKVRVGGIVSGHDYYHFTHSGVIEAVDVYVASHGIREWYLTQENEPSWFWVKPERERWKRVKTRVIDRNTSKK